MHVCVSSACLVPKKVRRGWVPWNWSYVRLQAAMLVLETQPRSLARQLLVEPSLQPLICLFIVNSRHSYMT